MRTILILLGTSALAACSGGGPTTVGGNAVQTPGGGTTTTHTFVNPTDPKTYQAIGASSSYSYSTDPVAQVQYGQLYAGNANTVRDTGLQITYNPRDGIFDMKIADAKSNTNIDTRFQDPAHRTAFGGALEPQPGAPDLTSKGVIYFENGTASGVFNTTGYSGMAQTFFYQKPGTTTKYVTYAGYMRNELNQGEFTLNGGTVLRSNYTRKRAAFVYGERTSNNAVPKTGTGTFTGQMLASMVYNPLLDVDPSAPTYYQWIDGTSTTTVDFAANSFTLALAGSVHAPNFDLNTSQTFAMPVGATFNAAGGGRIDLVNAGGFVGQFTSAYFLNGANRTDLTIAGSSIDGSFFGPAAEEVGGGFRVVGGTPDQRIDILGVFTGAR